MGTSAPPDRPGHLRHGKGWDQEILFCVDLPLDPDPANRVARVVGPEYRHPHACVDHQRHSRSSRTASTADIPLSGYWPILAAIPSMWLHSFAMSAGVLLLRGGTRRAISL